MTDSLSGRRKINKSMRFSEADQENLAKIKQYLKKKSPFNEPATDTEGVVFALKKVAGQIRTGGLE